MTAPLDPRLMALIVHDLRNPLNVIGLSLRMIDEELPEGHKDLREDVEILRENFYQLDRMLHRLSDYCRQYEENTQLYLTPFNPRRFLDEMVEQQPERPGSKTRTIRLEIAESCPKEVELDPGRARLAIQQAIENASVSAGGRPIRVVANGGPDRWVTRVIVDVPPEETVHPLSLRSDSFERLLGTSSERWGLELAITAQISERFGGSARLDVIPGQCSAIVLDWPVRATQN